MIKFKSIFRRLRRFFRVIFKVEINISRIINYIDFFIIKLANIKILLDMLYFTKAGVNFKYLKDKFI